MLNLESLHACNPSFTINPQNANYYVDLSHGRGDDVVKRLRRTIALSPNKPTFQLLTGHTGSGKTTELLRLKLGLEQQGFVVIYCATDEYLQIDDIGLTEIWLLILNLILQQVEKKGDSLSLAYLPNAIAEIEQWLHLPPIMGIATYSPRLQRILQTLQDNPQHRRQLRHHLEPRLKNSLLSAGEEVTAIEVDRLKQLHKKGLVILIDNLDRLSLAQTEIIFGDGGKYLRQFQCHVIYTMPLLAIANESQQRFQSKNKAITPIVLPTLALYNRQGEIDIHVLSLLRQVVLSRLLPNLAPEKRGDQVTKLFDHPETLNQLCRMSYGHLPYLLSLLYGCLQWQDPPIQVGILNQVGQSVQERCLATISDRDRQDLQQYLTSPYLLTSESISLCRRLIMFEQHDLDGNWFCSSFAPSYKH
jgi:energy-coupling factor transporter ATP-binding protein EcfA2